MTTPLEPSLEQIEVWRGALRGTDRYACLEAIDAVGPLGRSAASLIPDLTALLTSQDYVPCTAREYEFSGHALLAREAKGAIQWIGVAPAPAMLLRLLADHRTFLMPEASYDQGAYIGDYSSETIAPAAFAAELAEMMGVGGFELLDALTVNAMIDGQLIAWPAQRCIMRLADRLAEADAGQRQALEELTATLERLPDITQPRANRGFALRDLMRHLRKRLDTSAKAAP